MAVEDQRFSVEFVSHLPGKIASAEFTDDLNLLYLERDSGPIEQVATTANLSFNHNGNRDLHVSTFIQLAELINPDTLSTLLINQMPADKYSAFNPSYGVALGLTAVNSREGSAATTVAPLMGGSQWAINSALRYFGSEMDPRVHDTKILLKQHVAVLQTLTTIIFDRDDLEHDGSIKVEYLDIPRLALPESTTEAMTGIDGFESFAGIDDVIEELRDFVACATTPRGQLDLMGVRAAQAILLYGPSGTGKTDLLKKLGNELGAKVENVSLTDVADPMVGGWATKLDRIFEDAYKQSQPVLITLDEMESLTRTGNVQVTGNVTGVLKRQLERIKEYPHVFFAGATNDKDALDPIVLADKRIPLKLFIPAPTESQRSVVFEQFLVTDKLASLTVDDTEMLGVLSSLEYNFSELARETETFTAGDIKSVLEDIQRRKYLQARRQGGSTFEPPVQQEILAAIQRARRTRS